MHSLRHLATSDHDYKVYQLTINLLALFLQETVCPALMDRNSRLKTGIMMEQVNTVQKNVKGVGGMAE